MSDSTSPDAVARSIGLGADLPPAPAPESGRAATTAQPEGAGLEPRRAVAWWRHGAVRALVAPAALAFAGYLFTWGDVEQESRAGALAGGGVALGLVVFTLGLLWWGVRHLIGRPRPFGRTVFNYGLVAAIAVLGILGADELLG